LAGYRAVIDAATEYGHAFPMMMTAAGTVAPAKVLVMGAGVAGLQAIATAKRLGGVISAFDVRAAAKEQVQSLGATFVEVDAAADAETKGGYAKEMTEEYKQKQQAKIHETIKKMDIVICTALIPGKPAPILVTEAMVKDMKAGSVIVDLAAERGGNCELTECVKIVEKYDVKIIGHANVPSRIAADASALYAKNVLNFITLLIDKAEKKISIPLEDEIIKGTLLTHNGAIVHPNFAS
jgi:NAD(P) transhydrogenase subunit alpha